MNYINKLRQGLDELYNSKLVVIPTIEQSFEARATVTYTMGIGYLGSLSHGRADRPHREPKYLLLKFMIEHFLLIVGRFKKQIDWLRRLFSTWYF